MERSFPVWVVCLPWLLAAVAFPGIGLAQDYPPFGDPERWKMFDRYRALAVPLSRRGFIDDVHWIDHGRRFWFQADDETTSLIVVVDPASGTVDSLFNIHELTPALRQAGVTAIPSGGLRVDAVELVDGDRTARLVTNAATFDLDIATLAIRLTTAPDSPSPQEDAPASIVSPDGSKSALVRDGNVWVRWTETGHEVPITSDADPPFLVYRTSHGWAWSPDSRHLVLIRTDRRDLPKRPIVDWLSATEDVEFTYRYAEYPAAKQDILTWDTATAELSVLPVDLHGADPEWTVLRAWRPDRPELFVAGQFPSPRRVELVAVNLHSGGVRTVLVEHGDSAVQPDYTDLTLLDDGFIWTSDRNGFHNLFRYDFDGRLVGQLTPDEVFVDGDVTAVDRAGGWVYFQAALPSRPYESQFCRVRLDGTGFAVLTDGDGTHQGELSPDFRYFLDRHSSSNRPPRTDLRRTDGSLIRTLATTDIAPLRTQLGWVDAEEFVVKAADGETDLWGVLYKPYDFDPARQYPVVQFVYTTYWGWWWRSWMRDMGMRRLAQLGFVTVVFNMRGEGGARSRAYRRAFYRRVGCCEHDDAAAVLQQLAAERPYMDMQRVGILGGSWGGYHAARFLLMRPDVFTVGVAERGAMELARAGWPFMGTPEDNAAGYAAGSNLSLADRLQGKLLFVMPADDGAFSSTVRMIDALIHAGKPYDLLLVPGTGHTYGGVRGRIADDYVWTRMIPAYLVEHLIENADVRR
jgi:dipeptidyl aminopeptidase/acylaminoacyl peptidase